MKLVASLVVVLACHSDSTPPEVAIGYARDIEKLCNVSALSGADPSDPVGRQVTTATWLAANLETPESRTFLVTIQPLDGAAKGAALEAEARKLGLATCPLADEWR